PWFIDQSNVGHLSMQNGLWIRKEGSTSQIVVPNDDSLRRDILSRIHEDPLAGHPGCTRTAELVRRSFWWPRLAKDAENFVQTCDLCQRNKAMPDVNVITRSTAKSLGLPLKPSKKKLSTSSDPEVQTQEEVDVRGQRVTILPGTPHAVTLSPMQTLVVKDTPLFDFLVDNQQMHSVDHAVSDSATAFPPQYLGTAGLGNQCTHDSDQAIG
ncbi:hypothetical protein Vafri_20622, partial [Volvox africanus]